MTTNYICVYTGVSVRQAMKELIKQAADNDNISTIYVVDRDETFVEAIDLKNLIIARETTQLDSITITSYIISFQSLILDMAGNVGTQSLAVTIRILMDEQLGYRQKLLLIGKEARIGFVNGGILGILCFGVIGLYLIILKGQSAVFAFSISLCTGIALIVSILLASITGTIIPIIFKSIKIDPAVASGPLITTINDLVAVITYYGLAWILLIQILHF